MALLFLLAFVSVDGQAVNIPSFKLMNAAQDNVLMPAVGLGTGGDIPGRSSEANPEYWNNSVGYAASIKWFTVGGRSWDAAITYESEEGVADAILNVTNNWATTKRNEIWITSKIGPWDPMGYNETLDQMKIILSQFKTDYMDLLLVHWPSDNTSHSYASTDPVCNAKNSTYASNLCRQSVWKAMIEIFEKKQARAIGVSNFEIKHIMDIIDLQSGYLPSVNQIEFHGYWHEYNLVNWCQSNNITINGYAPLGTPDVMLGNWSVLLTEHPTAINIGNKYSKTASQVWERWQFQQNIVLNPRTENATHMTQNLHIFDFELEQEEMLALASVTPPINPKVTQDPSYMN